jgi:hypothetical protein
VFRGESMHMAFAFDVVGIVGGVRAEEPELFEGIPGIEQNTMKRSRGDRRCCYRLTATRRSVPAVSA